MTTLKTLLDDYRNAAVTEREKGTYFEELICAYLRNEAIYRDLYSDVWTYAGWASEQGLRYRQNLHKLEDCRKSGRGGQARAVSCAQPFPNL